MNDIRDLYAGAEKLITQLIRQESTAQGHYLTGALEDSLQGKAKTQGNTEVLEGFAAKYADYVNDGVAPEKASMKQWPFLVKYFQQRGYDEATSKQYAAMTIHKWMKEGMSTEASKKYSSTGKRQNMIAEAFEKGNNNIDDYMTSGLDYLVEEEFQKEKSETI